jgi:hypothetical protein
VSPPAPPPEPGGDREQRSRQRTEPIEFFIDRSLGRKHLAEALRELGNLQRIVRQARRRGPYIYGVYDGSIRRLWP